MSAAIEGVAADELTTVKTAVAVAALSALSPSYVAVMVFALELSPAALPAMARLAVAVPEAPDSVAVPKVVLAVENETVPVGVLPFVFLTVAERTAVPAVAIVSGLAGERLTVGLLLDNALPECQAVTNG